MSKKNFLTLLIVPLFLLMSCTNLDDINRRLDEHESRLQSLESLVKDANASINNLQKLLDAQSQKLTITSYKALENGTGYVLVMSDGSSITLKNGKDGNTPKIGVSDFEGVLYWTIDGEFMLDAKGMKIKAEGNDGTSGMTPKLRVNMDGHWEVSIDDGMSWTLVKDANGNPVKAVGSDATVDLTITEDEDNITIVYEGKTFIIPKKKGETPAPEIRPTLAIDYVADYNVNNDGTGFTTSHANNMSGYFNWNDAMAKFAIDKGFTIDGQKYHIPSQDEWCGIVPEYNGGKNIRFDTPTTTLDYVEKISIGGAAVKSYKSDYMSIGNKIAYGLRYKDNSNDQLSAWRYALIANPDGGSMMTITVRYLGPKKASTTIQQIADESWWSNNNDEDIIRTFPLTGIERENGSKTGVNDYAMYWLSTEGNTTTAYNMYIYSGGAHSDYSYSGKVFGTPIRLLKNEVQEPSDPTDPEGQVKLPIEYLTEYNVAPDAKSFVTNHKNNVSGFFTWEDATNKFSSISIDGKNYHLPSIAEWRGIINDNKLGFKDRTTYKDVEEEIQMGKNGEIKVYRSDYSSPEDYVTYGLRFTGIDGDKSMLSAWRYQFVDDPNSDAAEDMIVIITVRLLGKSFTGTIEDITKAEYWDTNNSQDITRYIPLSGWINVDNEVQMKGSNARFLSSTSTGKYCWYAFFTSYSLGLMDTTSDWYYDLNDRYTVRLFED